MKIVECKITKMPENPFDPMPQVIATFEDGSIKVLFTYYPDEIFFDPYEFIGLTEEDALTLYHAKDIAYLRS